MNKSPLELQEAEIPSSFSFIHRTQPSLTVIVVLPSQPQAGPPGQAPAIRTAAASTRQTTRSTPLRTSVTVLHSAPTLPNALIRELRYILPHNTYPLNRHGGCCCINALHTVLQRLTAPDEAPRSVEGAADADSVAWLGCLRGSAVEVVPEAIELEGSSCPSRQLKRPRAGRIVF